MSRRRGRFWYFTVVAKATDLCGEFDAVSTICGSASAARRIRNLWLSDRLWTQTHPERVAIYVHDRRREQRQLQHRRPLRYVRREVSC